MSFLHLISFLKNILNYLDLFECEINHVSYLYLNLLLNIEKEYDYAIHLRKEEIWMEKSIEKLHKLHGSVQKLESVLQEVWSLVEEIEEDVKFKELLNNAKKYHSSKQKPDKSLEELITLLDEFENSMNEIPADGTAAVDFEDAIAELIEWMRNNQ